MSQAKNPPEQVRWVTSQVGRGATLLIRKIGNFFLTCSGQLVA